MTLNNIQAVKDIVNKALPDSKLVKKRSTEELIQAAKKKDKSMDRSRKTPTKQERNDALFNAMLEYKESEQVHETSRPKKEEAEEWDVKIGDKIEFFDPTLSYELTGYRPVNETEGLDFDPKVFTQAADNYRQTGSYSNLMPGTFSHDAYWQQQYDLCTYGMTVGKYRITGENYFFLNFYRLLSPLAKGEEARAEDFPGFMAKQYEYFHYIELARKLQLDVLVFKCRGIGFSEILASNLVHGYMFHRASKSILSAYTQFYVDTTLSKAWQALDFLNTCTEGAFLRVRMKVDTQMKKRASQVDQDKNEFGWKAEIEGIVTDNPRKLRGARVYNLFFDEAGTFPGLVNAYIQARALVENAGRRVGQRAVGGTGGDEGPQLEGLKKMFYSPKAFQILPYKNRYGLNGEDQFTGFFIPSYEMWFGPDDNPGYDHRGVVDSARAKAHYEQTWATFDDPIALQKDKAEYCFHPEDAFLLEGCNNFDQEKLAEQKAAIEIHKTVPKPKRMSLRWQFDNNEINYDKRPQVQIGEGPVLFTEMPICDESGQPLKNLYCIGVDGIDQGTSESSGQTDVSKFAIIVYKRQFGLSDPKIVAVYKERPRHIKDAWEMTLKLALFYNAKVLIEYTRISVVHYFRSVGKLHMLMQKPKGAQTRATRGSSQIGVTPTQAVIEHYIDLIENYIVDYYMHIDYLELIDELISYSYENKRKFDLVAAFGMALLADEELRGRPVKSQDQNNNGIQIGYRRNEYGQVTFGADVKTESIKFNFFRDTGFRRY